MFHKTRTWKLAQFPNVILADKLSNNSWTLCQGFESKVKGVLFLNDSLSEDGAQEFAVVYTENYTECIQIESITFSWCDEKEALKLIKECEREVRNKKKDKDKSFQLEQKLKLNLDLSENHKCYLCE